MPKLILRRGDRTNPLIWLIAVLCAVLAVAVILTGLGVFIIYMIYEPRLPYLVVTGAHLDKLDYDQSSMMDAVVSLSIVAENDNARAHATFSELSINMRFHGIVIAELRADEFDVVKNGTVPLPYVVMTAAVPLDEGGREEMDVSLKRDLIQFELDGQARTRWRVGFILTVKLWTHLTCGIQFVVSNGSNTGLKGCSSKSHTI